MGYLNIKNKRIIKNLFKMNKILNMEERLKMGLLKHGYKTSKDYEKLFDLVHKQRVVCFVPFSKETPDKKDICQSQIREVASSISISARGISYVDAMEFNGLSLKEDFIRQCKECDLEFIEPNTLTNL